VVHRIVALIVLGCSTLLAADARAGLSYFLVAERPGSGSHGDSFVVPISDPGQVAHARDLAARGPDQAGAPIVFANIAPGSGGGINRDLLAPGTPEWNWHVTGVSGFGDIGIELLDSWPTYVAQHRDAWIKETGGKIGFWSYTIVKELPGYAGGGTPPTAVPLPPGALAGGAALAGLMVWQVRARRRMDNAVPMA
jgi:hypothetical protein